MRLSLNTILCMIFLIPAIYYYVTDISSKLIPITFFVINYLMIGIYCLGSGMAFPWASMATISTYLAIVFALQFHQQSNRKLARS